MHFYMIQMVFSLNIGDGASQHVLVRERQRKTEECGRYRTQQPDECIFHWEW
jgi:hypothetical protein